MFGYGVFFHASFGKQEKQELYINFPTKFKKLKKKHDGPENGIGNSRWDGNP